MTIFAYAARTGAGMLVRGTLRSQSVEHAALDLRRRALFITDLRALRGIRTSLVRVRSNSGKSRRAQLGFYRAFATMIASGVPIRRALEAAIERCLAARLREALRGVGADVDNGESLSGAMDRRPNEFRGVHVAMIRAGEAGGVLDAIIERIASSLEREHVVAKKLQAALAYPALVGCAAMALSVFVLAHVLPMFAQLFASFAVPLPAPTRVLLAVSAAAQSPLAWLICAVALVAPLVILMLALKAQASRRALERLCFRVPFVGALLHAAIVARVLRLLGILLASGVGVLEAFDVIAPATQSVRYTDIFHEMSRGLRRGDSLSAGMERSGGFDPLAIALVGIGEDTGRVDTMLLRVAEHFEVEVESAIATLSAIVEPFLIVVLGAIVGAIVFSIFIPLYTLIGSIS